MKLPESDWEIFLVILSSHLVHYFLLAGLAYFIGYVLLKKKLFSQKIQPGLLIRIVMLSSIK